MIIWSLDTSNMKLLRYALLLFIKIQFNHYQMDQRDISKKSQFYYMQIILSLTKTPTKLKISSYTYFWI